MSRLLSFLKTSKHSKDFIFSTLHFNFDTASTKHRDQSFVGRNLITACGNYTRGEFVIENAHAKRFVNVNIRGKWVAYWGDALHGSTNFSGRLSSMVSFLHEAVFKIDWKTIRSLQGMGFLQGTSDIGPLTKCGNLAGEDLSRPLLRPGSQAWRAQKCQEAAEKSTSEEDEDGVRRTRPGELMWGHGSPLQINLAGKKKPFHDGGGLPSQGRWHPKQRMVSESSLGANLRMRWLKILTGQTPASQDFDYKRAYCTLACQRAVASPSFEAMILEGRAVWREELARHGACEQIVSKDPPKGQPTFLHQLSEQGQISQNPDFRDMTLSSLSYGNGVTIGYNSKMPRVPAFFERKRRWGKLDEPWAVKHDEINYRSVKGLESQIQRQFEAGAIHDQMEEMHIEEAKVRGSQFLLADLGAQLKPNGKTRVLHDGARKVSINSMVIQRDQTRAAGAGELSRALSIGKAEGRSMLGLVGDAADAHRMPRHIEADWYRLACRIKPEKVWINKVGTFGISSAGYWWGRLISLPQRFQYALLERAAVFFSLLMADDWAWLSSGPHAILNILIMPFYLN